MIRNQTMDRRKNTQNQRVEVEEWFNLKKRSMKEELNPTMNLESKTKKRKGLLR